MEGGREAGIIIIHNIIKHSFDPMVHVQPNPQDTLHVPLFIFV